jgi:hypothetical protein
VWWSISSTRARQQLINETLAKVLERRGAKQLDRIGELLKPAAGKFAVAVAPPGDGWMKWWRNWRKSNERKSVLSRLGLRRSHR